MRLLLDTHTFIWWVIDDAQLSDAARGCIANPDNDVFLSTASAWEIVIKVNIGKLILPEPPQVYIPSRLSSNQFESLPIQLNHVLQVAALPNHHHDPFDRILVTQSQVEQMPILPINNLIAQYSVNIIWYR
ncbi:MAG: type II toxin-antitoxin system VapC family toxin [Chroococcidiopsidaceae cyanobacterium CP_BM_RX_35]|nr:type II toxin-antitoxin system VapC family toxin [Chroococcidiopsidaceae cyanobacterium CP_BM_RX_35]